MAKQSSNKTLLILDDEPRILKSLQRVLSADAYKIHCFTRPFDAIELLQEATVGVIIADQCMPQMEGDAFLAVADKCQPQAVRIAITGYSDDAYQQRAENSTDAWRYLTKPWDNDELRQVVSDAFHRFNEAVIKDSEHR